LLDLKLLLAEIAASKDDFVRYDEDVRSVKDAYMAKLPLIDGLDLSANDRLKKYSGCKVLEEGAHIRRFAPKFESRQRATDWALKVLQGRNLAAVDGSQIYPSPHYSLPVGLAQACTVMNGHKGKNSYSTTSTLKLMTPADMEESGGYAYAQSPVSLKRFRMECDQIATFTDSCPGDAVFMDGSLVLSFITQTSPWEQMRYVKSIHKILEASERNRSPVIAYTDMSLCKDLVTMMRFMFNLPPTTHLCDAFLVREELNWGDRTRVFLCDRDDRPSDSQPSVLDLYGDRRDTIAFFYINSSGGLPSKVEIPSWCANQGLTDQIADIIRAECIVRPGYPDIIHRAHEYVTINNAESGLFENVIDTMAQKHQINLFKSAKELNKKM